MRGIYSLLLAATACSQAGAAALFYNAATPAENTAKYNLWLSDMGISMTAYFQGFDGYAVGTNLNGVMLNGGLTINHPSGNAIVQSLSSFFGGSNPRGVAALALAEVGGDIVLDFFEPVDYIGGFDIDQPGATWRVVHVGGSTASFSIESTGSSGDSAEFWGVWRNDMPRIRQLIFSGTSGGDGEWGLDDLTYGAVPEPSAIVAFGGALAALAIRRKRA